MPPSSIQSAWQIYADQLIMLGYGTALWQPAPLDNYERVHIGDVGYIRGGHFHLLFNAAQPLGDRVIGVDVPKKFVSLNAGPTFKGQPRLPGALHTEDVKQIGMDIGVASEASLIDARGTFRFESESKKGAILLTKHKTYSEDVERLGHFKDYTLQHYSSWLEFANQQGHGLNLEDLLFITGHDLTKDFAMAAFSANARNIAIEFDATLPTAASAVASVWGTWRTTMSVHHNCGPQHREPPLSLSVQATPMDIDTSDPWIGYKQCVFLRAFRIRKRAKLFPTVIKAAAGPHDLGPGKHSEGDGATMVAQENCSSDDDVSAVLDSPPWVDPLEPMFQHLFKNNADADIALIHDYDISQMLKLLPTLAGEGLEEYLARISSDIVVVTNGAATFRIAAEPTIQWLDMTPGDKRPENTMLPFPVAHQIPKPPFPTKEALEDIGEDSTLMLYEHEGPGIPLSQDNLAIAGISRPFQNPLDPTATSDFSYSSTSSSSRNSSSCTDSPFTHRTLTSRTRRRYRPMATTAARVSTDDEDDYINSHMNKDIQNRLARVSTQRILSEILRRNELEEAYTRLKDTLPSSGTKTSEVSLLDHAVMHINHLEMDLQQSRTRLREAEANLLRLQRFIESKLSGAEMELEDVDFDSLVPSH